jgi:flagellar motor component MotA
VKHHNLYRLALIGYIGGGFLVVLGFLLAVLAILTGWDAPEGLAYLFIPTGIVVLIGGGSAHLYAIEKHKELKPLAKPVRDEIDKKARERRADLLLEQALEQEEERTRAIEGRPLERPKRDDPWH